MKCPHCNHADTRVIDSRPAEDNAILRRRRICDNCGLRFTTHERTLMAPLMVAKKDGRREEFAPAKLRNGLVKACNKLAVSTAQIESVIEAVEGALRQEAPAEVTAELIGEVVMEQLFQVNQVAYVRFASVYQRFDDVQLFAQMLERMSRSGRRPPRPTADTTAIAAAIAAPAEEPQQVAATTAHAENALAPAAAAAAAAAAGDAPASVAAKAPQAALRQARRGKSAQAGGSAKTGGEAARRRSP
jgi:transcriptional repressor NrdR